MAGAGVNQAIAGLDNGLTEFKKCKYFNNNQTPINNSHDKNNLICLR
jgi:hypothetical protein